MQRDSGLEKCVCMSVGVCVCDFKKIFFGGCYKEYYWDNWHKVCEKYYFVIKDIIRIAWSVD